MKNFGHFTHKLDKSTISKISMGTHNVTLAFVILGTASVKRFGSWYIFSCLTWYKSKIVRTDLMHNFTDYSFIEGGGGCTIALLYNLVTVCSNCGYIAL